MAATNRSMRRICEPVSVMISMFVGPYEVMFPDVDLKRPRRLVTSSAEMFSRWWMRVMYRSEMGTMLLSS